LESIDKFVPFTVMPPIDSNYCNLFLYVSFQVRGYVPDLAQSLAGLVMWSNDTVFGPRRVPHASRTGLRDQDISEAEVKSSVSEKMARIIEMNDVEDI
jgi:hypothetical protein